MIATAAPSLSVPLASFVSSARVELALVMETNGRVLAQHGFTRSLDVMSGCSLAAAVYAASCEMGRQLGGEPFGPLHYGGARREVFLAPMATMDRTVLLLAVFDRRSSLGIVRHFWTVLARQLERASVSGTQSGSGDLDRDLRRNLAVIFGRA